MAISDVSVGNQSTTQYVRISGIVFPPDSVTPVPIATFRSAKSRIEANPNLYLLADIDVIAESVAAAEDVTDNPVSYEPENYTVTGETLGDHLSGIDTGLGNVPDPPYTEVITTAETPELTEVATTTDSQISFRFPLILNGILHVWGYGVIYPPPTVTRRESKMFDGTTWTEWSGVPDGVLSACVHDGAIYMGGTKFVRKWDGTSWTSVTLGADLMMEGYITDLISFEGDLYALSYGFGKVWKFNGTEFVEISNPSSSGPNRFFEYEGVLYFQNNSEVHRLDPGKTSTSLVFNPGVNISECKPVIHNGKVYFGSGSGNVYEWDGVTFDLFHTCSTAQTVRGIFTSGDDLLIAQFNYISPDQGKVDVLIGLTDSWVTIDGPYVSSSIMTFGVEYLGKTYVLASSKILEYGYDSIITDTWHDNHVFENPITTPNILGIDHEAQNYTATDTDLKSHLAGIDEELGAVPTFPAMVASSSGVTDAGKLVVLSDDGKLDTSLMDDSTSDQMLQLIGGKDATGTTNNYFKIAEWTLSGSYGTFAAHISVMTTSKPGLYDLYILCALDGAGTSFADPAFRLKDVFSMLGTSTFFLTVDNATLKATLYFKNPTDYEPHYVVRIDTILNATTMVLSNTDIGTDADPTGTFAKGPTVT